MLKPHRFVSTQRLARWPANTLDAMGSLRGHWLALVVCACLCTPARAQVDVNSASEADLDSLRGLGPAMTARILAQRAQSPFADWADLMRRVKGLRTTTARHLAEQGLSVNGQALPPSTVTPAKAR